MIGILTDKFPDLDLEQTASAMAAAGDWPALRDLAEAAFRSGAAGVAQTLTPERYDEVKNAIASQPNVTAAHDLYKSAVESEIHEAHALHDGVFAEDLGDLNTYFPLLTDAKDANRMTAGRRLPYRAPRNINNVFATGLSSRGYTTDLPTFAKWLASSLRASGKSGLLRTLQREGWAAPQPAKWNGLFQGPDGIVYQGAREESQAARTIIVNGRIVKTTTSNIVMPLFMNEGLKSVLAREVANPEDVVKAVQFLNMLSTKALPFEVAYHTSGMFGAMYGNTPYVNGNTLAEKMLTAPLIKGMYLRYKLFKTNPSTPENAKKLIRIAKIGALPARTHTVTYSKQVAEETGAKQEPWYTWGPMLYGPNGFDARARIMMYDMAMAANPNMPDEYLGDFINQIGNYTPEFQGMLERGLKRWGFGPFATAAMTRTVNGFHAATGTGPMPKRNDAGWKLADIIARSALFVLGAYILSYRALTGKWPTEDKRFKMWDIPVGGGNGWIDQFRHSKVGDLSWGNGNEVGYIHVGGMIAPLAARVTPKEAINRWIRGGSLEQVKNGLEADGFNILTHPALGPFTQAAIVAATGHTPYMTDLTDRTGKGGPQFMSALPQKIKPGFIGGLAPALSSETPTKHPGFSGRLGATAAATIAQLSSTAGVIGQETGLLGDEDRKGSLIFRTVMNLALPGVLGSSSNPSASENYLMQQKRNLAEMSLPDALKTYEAANPDQKQEMFRIVRDKVYAAKTQGRLSGDTAALAQHYFGVKPAMMVPPTLH
jgi:hypothetical protein